MRKEPFLHCLKTEEDVRLTWATRLCILMCVCMVPSMPAEDGVKSGRRKKDHGRRVYRLPPSGGSRFAGGIVGSKPNPSAEIKRQRGAALENCDAFTFLLLGQRGLCPREGTQRSPEETSHGQKMVEPTSQPR